MPSSLYEYVVVYGIIYCFNLNCYFKLANNYIYIVGGNVMFRYVYTLGNYYIKLVNIPITFA